MGGRKKQRGKQKGNKPKVMLDSIATSIIVDILVELTNTVSVSEKQNPNPNNSSDSRGNPSVILHAQEGGQSMFCCDQRPILCPSREHRAADDVNRSTVERRCNCKSNPKV